MQVYRVRCIRGGSRCCGIAISGVARDRKSLRWWDGGASICSILPVDRMATCKGIENEYWISSPTAFVQDGIGSVNGRISELANWSERMVARLTDEQRNPASDLLDFINASPSPWHAVNETIRRLVAGGFQVLDESGAWTIVPGGRYFVVRNDSSLVAFAVGQHSLLDRGFRLIGAHTDSPGLRLKPLAAHSADGVFRLGVEIYGGPILATFTDRDLGLAGRVMVRTPDGVRSLLYRSRMAPARLPNLAIHMNREVNETGLRLNKQTELPLLWGIAGSDSDPQQAFLSYLADEITVATKDILAWDIVAFDSQPGQLWGTEGEFIASRQLDNLASCHAGLTALLAADSPSVTCVLGLFDHEEVGSTSGIGADGSFLEDVLERVSQALDASASDLYRRALARSFLISADMAHAWNPNFPAAYEPAHRVFVNHGPVIKTNANQRYSTRADTAAYFMELCQKCSVPFQHYSHRTDLGCGSTIGPLLAARLGIPSVDVGSPMWAMHSARESAGVVDHALMARVLTAFFRNDIEPVRR